jgi:hypothetical protein
VAAAAPSKPCPLHVPQSPEAQHRPPRQRDPREVDSYAGARTSAAPHLDTRTLLAGTSGGATGPVCGTAARGRGRTSTTTRTTSSREAHPSRRCVATLPRAPTEAQLRHMRGRSVGSRPLLRPPRRRDHVEVHQQAHPDATALRRMTSAARRPTSPASPRCSPAAGTAASTPWPPRATSWAEWDASASSAARSWSGA